MTLEERLTEAEKLIITLQNEVKVLNYNLAELKMEYVGCSLEELEDFLQFADEEETETEKKEAFLTIVRGGKLDS